VSGQHNAPSALPLGKRPPVPIVQEAGWIPELVCTGAEPPPPPLNSIPGASGPKPVAIPTELSRPCVLWIQCIYRTMYVIVRSEFSWSVWSEPLGNSSQPRSRLHQIFELVLYHTMKTLGRNGSATPCILNLATCCGLLASWTFQALHCQRQQRAACWSWTWNC
jgi:hypothetical protein